ncbi:MAG: UDP-N-acetylglucosamine 2-epimerase (non-hydrolyzing), partial [Deltaproteobacteria bacterium]|nr:UDP-N-acetylglucosamine 2-epimerase (non-hydrolyzing) [Deltaproteobacteria bacterium]
NLLREGVEPARIHVTGNTVVDALLEITGREYRFADPALAALPARTILSTAHRRESFGEPFRQMCLAMRAIAEMFPDCALVYPVHLNPNVREPVYEILSGAPNIRLVEPLDYEPFVHLMKEAHVILTDSGGVQEEAPSLGKPVLVMREKTERPEGIEAGTVRLVGNDGTKIVSEVSRLLDDADAYRAMAEAKNPYGDGLASKRIADILPAYCK